MSLQVNDIVVFDTVPSTHKAGREDAVNVRLKRDEVSPVPAPGGGTVSALAIVQNRDFPDLAPSFPQELKNLNRWIVRTADKVPHSAFEGDENQGPIDPHETSSIRLIMTQQWVR